MVVYLNLNLKLEISHSEATIVPHYVAPFFGVLLRRQSNMRPHRSLPACSH